MFRLRARRQRDPSGLMQYEAKLLITRGDHESVCGVLYMTTQEWTDFLKLFAYPDRIEVEYEAQPSTIGH